MTTTIRNNSVDYLKLICALLVVFIHCDYPYKSEILPITDIAVPLFFCMSGYFVCGAKRSVNRIKRIGVIVVWSFLLYLLKTEIFYMLTQHRPFIPTQTDVINLVCFNDVVFAIHLWYLSAYLYLLVIAYVIDKYDLWKTCFYTIIPLLLIGMYIKYHVNNVCVEQIYYYRNWAFVGLPYFMAGALVKAKTPHCKTLKGSAFKMCLFLFTIVLLIFRYKYSGSGMTLLMLREMNLLLLVICIFLLTIHTEIETDNIISRLGKNYSLYIYIFHLVVMSSIEMAATKLPMQIYNSYMYINPIVVFFVTIGLTYLLGKMKIVKL